MLLEKYEPKTTNGVLGNYAQVRQVKDWLAKWKKGKALLLYGPTGSGKSLAARLAAKEMGLDVVESHASDYRNKAEFDGIVSMTKQNSVFGRKRAIIVEDIDLIESKKSLYTLINSSSAPVILIGEESKPSLMRSCTTIRFSKVPDSILLGFLKKIAAAERISVSDVQLAAIIKSCNGDVRAALIDMEFLSFGTRERTSNIYEVVRAVFKDEKTARILLEEYSSFDSLLMWVAANIAEELKTNGEIADAYSYLSKADVMRSRIGKRQSWALQKYVVELILKGIQASRKERPRTFVSYKTPWIARKYNEETMEKIGRTFHIAKKSAHAYTHVLNTLDDSSLVEIGMDEDDVDFIRKAGKK